MRRSANMQAQKGTKINDTNNKRIRKNKKKKIKLLIAIILIVMVVLIGIGSYIMYFNSKLRKNIQNSTQEQAILNYKYDLLILSNENKNLINEKGIKISNSKYEYVLNNVSNFNKIGIKLEEKNYKLTTDNYANSYIVNLNQFVNDNIKIYLPGSLKDKEYIDIYKVENGNLEVYKKSERISEDFSIIIDKVENVGTYVITYVALEDIVIDSENLEINKNQEYDLNCNFYPENATYTAITCMAESDIVDIDGSKITGKSAGETKLNITNGNINKTINLKINEVANDIAVSRDVVTLQVGQEVTVEAHVEPQNAINNEIEWVSDDTSIATVENGKIKLVNSGSTTITVRTTKEPIVSKQISVGSYKIYPAPAKFNDSGLTYIDGVLLVNKKYSVPSTFAPGVNSTALAAFNDMKAEAARYGYNLTILSSYRSYATQAGLFDRYSKLYGEEEANTFSARAGTSEHQTGLAFDISSLEESYGNTPEGKWLAQNCAKYGFIIRYLKSKESITGYIYEPWHIRYLGTVKAQEVAASGLCLEEFLGV